MGTQVHIPGWEDFERNEVLVSKYLCPRKIREKAWRAAQSIWTLYNKLQHPNSNVGVSQNELFLVTTAVRVSSQALWVQEIFEWRIMGLGCHFQLQGDLPDPGIEIHLYSKTFWSMWSPENPITTETTPCVCVCVCTMLDNPSCRHYDRTILKIVLCNSGRVGNKDRAFSHVHDVS